MRKKKRSIELEDCCCCCCFAVKGLNCSNRRRHRSVSLLALSLIAHSSQPYCIYSKINMQHVVHVALSIAWLTATWGGPSGRELQLAPSPMGAKWRGNRGSKGPTTANTTDSNQRKQPSAVRPARSAAFYVISSRGSVTKWSFLSLSPFPFVFVDVMFFFSLFSFHTKT